MCMGNESPAGIDCFKGNLFQEYGVPIKLHKTVK